MNEACVICQIIDGTTPARIVHQDEHVVAFLPLELNTRGHTVVAPIRHCADIFDIEDGELSSMMHSIRSLAEHCKRRLGADGINLLHASGEAAQQSVPHFHIHLLPRFKDDNLDAWPSLPEWNGDLDELLTELKLHD
jgi:histidine triad (HIT) family protein